MSSQILPEQFPGNHLNDRCQHVIPCPIKEMAPRLKGQRNIREQGRVLPGGKILMFPAKPLHRLLRPAHGGPIVVVGVGNSGGHGQEMAHLKRALRLPHLVPPVGRHFIDLQAAVLRQILRHRILHVQLSRLQELQNGHRSVDLGRRRNTKKGIPIRSQSPLHIPQTAVTPKTLCLALVHQACAPGNSLPAQLIHIPAKAGPPLTHIRFSSTFLLAVIYFWIFYHKISRCKILLKIFLTRGSPPSHPFSRIKIRQILDDPQAIRPIAEMIYDLVNQKKHLDIEEISGYANNKE